MWPQYASIATTNRTGDHAATRTTSHLAAGRSPDDRKVQPVETAVLIPIKSFRAAKARLAGAVSAERREALARFLAERVVRAAQPLPTFVACDDEEVATWADDLGASVLWGPGLGLNGAIDHGIATIAGKGAEHVIISHGDIPLAQDLRRVARTGHVVLVPDRRRDGTNVLARPCDIDLPAAYGGGSFQAHLSSALATGAPVTVRFDHRLSIDIDTVVDCRHPLVAGLLSDILGPLSPED
jgi:2-phospho-L-lactate guanylyltransferase